MGDVGAAAVAARMAGAGLLIPIPNSGPRPPRWPRQAGEQQLTPRPAVPRPPGPAPRPPGRWLASGPARGPSGRCGDRETWLRPNQETRQTGRHWPSGLCLPVRRRPGWAGAAGPVPVGSVPVGSAPAGAVSARPAAGQHDVRGYRKQFPPVLIKSRRRGPRFGTVIVSCFGRTGERPGFSYPGS